MRHLRLLITFYNSALEQWLKSLLITLPLYPTLFPQLHPLSTTQPCHNPTLCQQLSSLLTAPCAASNNISGPIDELTMESRPSLKKWRHKSSSPRAISLSILYYPKYRQHNQNPSSSAPAPRDDKLHLDTRLARSSIPLPSSIADQTIKLKATSVPYLPKPWQFSVQHTFLKKSDGFVDPKA